MKNFLKIAGVLLVLIIALGYFVGGGEEAVVQHEMDKVHNMVAQDALQQYEIAKRQGDKVQIFVQAGLVSAAYLQAKDEENYRKWKEIEKQAAAEAGMPQMP